MELTLREIRRSPTDDRYIWTPFEPNEEFNGEWWDSPPYLIDEPHYVNAMLDGIEVARVELDYDFGGSMHLGAPKLGSAALEIQFFEVAKSYRRQGVGVEVVQRLIARYPDRRLLALSEDADEFWASLGWSRYDYNDGTHQYRPLFVAPV